MRLVIAEKPSLGRSIAQGLKAMNPNARSESGEGYIIVGQDIVTWCVGHILELAAPAHYNPIWEKWDINQLPIHVEKNDWILLPKEQTKGQLGLIRRLLKSPSDVLNRDVTLSEVINAGDPDREGQMLVDEVLEFFDWKGETKRVLIYDTTPAGIKKAFSSLRDNGEFKNLFEAAKCRSRADWLVGINFSRVASKRIGLVASIGRVQTPTLALIVKRDLLIEGHTASEFYTLHASVSTLASLGSKSIVSLTMDHEDPAMRITDKKEAERIAAALSGQQVAITVTEKQVREGAPLPYTLATFHKAGEAAFGWSAARSLQVLQELYEKKLVSYPRTACPYLPEEHAKNALSIADNLLGTGAFPKGAPLRSKMAPAPKVYNDKKVEEHHGVVPTMTLPGADLTTDQRNGWMLVATQFLRTLLPDYLSVEKNAQFAFEERVFKAKGHTALNLDACWRVLDLKPIEPSALPLEWGDGQRGPGRVQKVDRKVGKTTPPKRYTESTLVDDMIAVAKYVTHPQLKAILKENAGIGTPATHGAILETLKSRGYIEIVNEAPAGEEGKPGKGRKKVPYLRSTPFGRYLIQNMPPVLSDVGVTAVWEHQLDRIAKGEADSSEFMEKIANYVTKHVNGIREMSLPTPPAQIQPKAAIKKAKRPFPTKEPVQAKRGTRSSTRVNGRQNAQ